MAFTPYLPQVELLGVIVTLVPKCVMISHNSSSMSQNFKIVPHCALCGQNSL